MPKPTQAAVPEAVLPEAVVIVHGLLNTPLTMLKMAQVFNAAGYTVFNWGYNSLRGGLPAQIERLAPSMAQLQGFSRVHGVGHSQGGLMLRGLFTAHARGLPLGRLVLIGTPNQGAGVVRRHQRLFSGRFNPLNRPIIHDLAEGSVALAQLPIPAMDIGVIAGVGKWNPINPLSWLNALALGDEPHDGTVEARNTRLMGERDYTELPVHHLALPFAADVIKQSLSFIRTGHFAPESPAP